MIRMASLVVVAGLVLPSVALATDITLLFGNSGGAIASLEIVDLICKQARYSGQFAANDGKRIDGFCVNDAANLVTDVQISRDGTANTLSNVPANSTIDVFTWKVTPP